jgi:hypothetical protein
MAAAMFEKFPHADVYSRRKKSLTVDKPGTIVVCGDGEKERLVINMMAQYYPGKAKFPNSELDGLVARKRYFYNCLKQIAEIPDLSSIALPYGIGCGAAGGNWGEYLVILEKFAKFVRDRATVTLVRLPPDLQENSKVIQK